MTTDRLHDVAERYEAVAAELRRAAEHAETAAGHFRTGEVPRGCAHAFALEGHARVALDAVAQLSKRHAERSRP